MIHKRATICLGIAQMISWGTTYYVIGVFGHRISGDLGWSRELVYSGFSVGLLVMGLSSPFSGTIVDRRGGVVAMSAGSLLNAAGCLVVAASWNPTTYLLGWCVVGLGMRLSLYDAAFATLARICGPGARRSMAQITLLGGLASTVFWPLGNALADVLGWRVALCGYACITLTAIPFYLPLPKHGFGDGLRPAPQDLATQTYQKGQLRSVAFLYATIVAMTSFLNSGMSAHMIPILAALGLGGAGAVSAAIFRGIGQSMARLCDVLFGRSMHPSTLNLISTSILSLAFALASFATGGWLVGAIFAFSYGAGNGLVTITRGSLPLVLFDHRSYGRISGRLIAPSFLLAAGAPLAFTRIITTFGEAGALWASLALAFLAFLASVGLNLAGRDRSS